MKIINCDQGEGWKVNWGVKGDISVEMGGVIGFCCLILGVLEVRFDQFLLYEFLEDGGWVLGDFEFLGFGICLVYVGV